MMQRGSSFDYNKLYQEAQSRWLKNLEVLFILQNHENLPIEEEAPEMPISGSLFLFNRRVLRFFRKDGHTWKKKKDGRAIDEGHERLKVGNADALSCYYARGETNPYFQRRIYWMLNPAYDHIVLVHYREVSEGRSLPPTVSQQPQEQLSSRNESSSGNKIQLKGAPSATSEIYDSHQSYCSPICGEVNSMHIGRSLDTDWLNMSNISANSDPLSQPEINQALRDLEEQLSLDSSDDNVLGDMFPAFANAYKNLDDPALLDIEIGVNGKHKGLSLVWHHGIELKSYPSWTDMLKLSSRSAGLGAHGKAASSLTLADGPELPCHTTSASGTYHCIGNEFKHGTVLRQFSSENIFDAPFGQLEQISWRQPGQAGNNAEHIADGSDINSQLSAARRFLLGSDILWSPNSVTELAEGELCNTPVTTGGGPNSNGVSVRKENSIDCMGTNISDSNNAYSSDLLGMCSDQGQHGTSLAPEPCLTVAQKPLFRIHEISPEWSFSFESTKVIITGNFRCNPSAYSWAVMFGKVEVPAEIVQEGVLRCQAPEHSIGKVTLYITTGNSESCSEVREFEFRTKSASSSLEILHHKNATKNSEELSLLVKFVRVLLFRSDDLSVTKGDGPRDSEYHRKFEAADEQWLQLHEHQTEISSGAIDGILQELIKDKFQQWLLCKTNAKEDRNRLLSKEEQHIIHMISGLGYEWALTPILDAGVGINFRDANGMTALHWAARFGREKMAAALLAAGALAGAVTDPTPQDPVGKTAGAIASASGHKGLAGYLSEADLTSHLSSIAMKECEVSKGLAVVDDEKAVKSISEREALLQVDETEDEISLKDSLAAARNATQAAARIQAAFRAHSFRKKHEKTAVNRDENRITLEDIYRINTSSKIHRALHSYQHQKFDKAALSIQKKYRGWKGRKDFRTFRQLVVKIQARVRSHQARKKYVEFLWMVGVLEKLVLRWRRRGVGLRGFWLESDLADQGEDDEEDIIKVFRKQKVDAALEQALSRVFSMVESPRARVQYRRMLEIYREVKARQGCAEETM